MRAGCVGSSQCRLVHVFHPACWSGRSSASKHTLGRRHAREGHVQMADTKMLAEKVEAARQLVPAMLRDVKPDVLASSILPTLLKPWPDSSRAAFGVGNDEEPRRSLASPSKLRHMRSDYLPLLQEDQYVVCKSCGRTLLLDVFDEHIRVCASLPIALLQKWLDSAPVATTKIGTAADSALWSGE